MQSDTKKLILNLLAPSWLSGLVAVTAGLFVSIGVIAIFSTHNSQVQQQLIVWQGNQPQRQLTTPDQVLQENDHPTVRGSWPLILFWAAIGLLVYGVTLAIVHWTGSVKQLHDELEYVNADPKHNLEVAAEHFALRGVSAIIFIIMGVLLVKQVLPYSITAAHASAVDLLSGTGALYAVLSFAIIVVTLHLQVIFLRLAFGRVRIL